MTTFKLRGAQLVELALFRGESPEALDWLAECCGIRQLAAEEVLLRPGQENDTLYVILEGHLRVQIGPNAVLNTMLEPGTCVGEMSILEKRRVADTVVADGTTRVMEISSAHLWRLIALSHAVACNLLVLLSSRLRQDNQALAFYELRARLDVLTGLHNRRWLDEMLPRLIERCRRSGSEVSLLMLDIDRFKRYNDDLGHMAGDAALRSVARVLSDHIRPLDMAARFGGEEFVLAISETGRAHAMELAERLRCTIGETRPRGIKGEMLPGVTVSMGVATLVPGQEAHDLLHAADMALYRAKQMGRDRVCCFP